MSWRLARRPADIVTMTFLFRLAARNLSRNRGAAAGIVVILGFAVAANVALFAVTDQLLLRQPGFAADGRVVHVELPLLEVARLPTYVGDVRAIEAHLARRELIEQSAHVISVAPFDEGGEALLEWRLRATAVSSGFFDLTATRPIIGRPLTDSDALQRPRPVLLGHDVWRLRYGSDPGVVNRVVEIPGTKRGDSWRIVGVMPDGFRFPRGANLWVAAGPSETQPDVPTFARLARGVTAEQVRAELPLLRVQSLADYHAPHGARTLLVLLAASTCLLAVALIQVSSLSTALIAGRRRQIGVQLAIGARKSQIVGQVAVEAVVVGAAALAGAWLAIPSLISLVAHWLPPAIVETTSIVPDRRALLYSLIVAVGSIGLLTALPLALVLRSSPIRLLAPAHTRAFTKAPARLRVMLFALQLALTSALLYLSLLAGRSYAGARGVDLGFQPGGVVAAWIPPAAMPRDAPAERLRGLRALDTRTREAAMERLRSAPGVVRVATAYAWPMQPGGFWVNAISSSADPTRESIRARATYVGSGYIDTIGARVIEGREPTPDEASASLAGSGTAVVTRALAARLAAFGPVIGQHIFVTATRTHRIVGIIENLKLETPDETDAFAILIYYAYPSSGRVILVRGHHVSSAVGALRDVFESLWSDRPPPALVPVTNAVTDASADFRGRAAVLALATILSLPLTLIGVAGALAYAVSQRSREFAIEVALGADPGRIQRRVLSEASVALGLGIGAGLGLGVAAGSFVGSLTLGVHPADAATLAAALAAMATCGLAAAWFPALRAAHVNPAGLLRETA